MPFAFLPFSLFLPSISIQLRPDIHNVFDDPLSFRAQKVHPSGSIVIMRDDPACNRALHRLHLSPINRSANGVGIGTFRTRLHFHEDHHLPRLIKGHDVDFITHEPDVALTNFVPEIRQVVCRNIFAMPAKILSKRHTGKL